MDASLESLCAASETAPLLHNGQHSRGPVPRTRVLQPQAAPRQRVQRSQPVSILAVRWAPTSPRGPEGGWWGHCATPPPLGGQRVGGGVTVPPRLRSGVRGWVVGSLRHPASARGSEGGWWGHCSTCLPLRVRGWVVGSRCRALLGRPLLSLHPAGPLGGWTWYPVQFRSVLCALALCQVSGVCRNTVQGHYCVSSSVIPNSLPSHGLSPVRLLCPWDFPGKNTGAGCHFLLQGIFPTQDSNADLHCRQILFRPSHQGSPK